MNRACFQIGFMFLFCSVTVQAQNSTITYQLRDLITHQPVDIELSNPKTTMPYKVVKTQSGSYKLVGKSGASGVFRAQAKGYEPVADTFVFPAARKSITKILEFQPRKKETLFLPAIFFAQASTEISEVEKIKLDTLALRLQKYPSLKLEVEGYTEAIGDSVKNISLSWQRAEGVKNYLVTKGVAPQRLILKAYGGDKASQGLSNETQRALYRRVEFTIAAP